MTPLGFLIMGVSGSGKTTLAKALANRLGWDFLDADDFHPPQNIAKMTAGIPLDDSDRTPWLASIHELLLSTLKADRRPVLACSALKEKYRAQLLDGLDGIVIVHLVGSYELIRSRLQRRGGHFMKAEMLRSQFEALESPQQALTVDVSLPLGEAVEAVLKACFPEGWHPTGYNTSKGNKMQNSSLNLDFLLRQIGEAGKRLSKLGAAEGAAGNISICVREELDVSRIFPEAQTIDPPLEVPELAGATVIVTGSGRRLREIAESPGDNLACIRIGRDGKKGEMFTVAEPPFRRVTSEFNSHLAIHHDRMKSDEVTFQAVLHAQPMHLTYLSHIPAYQEQGYFNRHLFRWQPETILSIPQGIGVLPFIVNGSDEQMTATVRSMREHPLVVWARHGVVARSDDSVLHALDLIEYAEAAARYETLNLSTGEKADGLSPGEVRRICEAWGVTQKIY